MALQKIFCVWWKHLMVINLCNFNMITNKKEVEVVTILLQPFYNQHLSTMENGKSCPQNGKKNKKIKKL